MAAVSKLATDPTKIVKFAVGDPAPKFEKQQPNKGINFGGVYFDHPKRYVLKKARFSTADHRIFDYDTGRLVIVSHHPGKNPFGDVDPLDVAGTDGMFSFMGEWASLCNVTAYEEGFKSFKVRPKKLSRHGRQYIKGDDDKPIMNVGKIGRLSGRSLRKQFSVGRGGDDDPVYKCAVDIADRTIQVVNLKGKPIAQITKSSKNLILTAALGVGKETIIDIAPGVDCSAILCLVIGLKQVGAHYASDAFKNFVKEPIVGHAVDEAQEQLTGGGEEGNEDGGGDIGEGDAGGLEIPEIGEVPDVGEMPDLSAVGEADVGAAIDAIGETDVGGAMDALTGLFETFFG